VLLDRSPLHLNSPSQPLTARSDDAVRMDAQLRRFATVADTCDRVLGAGVACRFEGRLLPAYEAVKKMKEEDSIHWTSRSPERRVLYHAGACPSPCVHHRLARLAPL
jgi:hypothetical protein